MSRRRSIKNYPKECAETFEQARGKTRYNPLVVIFNSNNEAKSARRLFYAFREALYDEPEEYPQLTILAPWIVFGLKNDSLYIHIKPHTGIEEY